MAMALKKRTLAAGCFFTFAVLSSMGLYVSAPRLFMSNRDRELSLSVMKRDVSTTRALLNQGADPNSIFFRSQRYVDAEPVLSVAAINDDSACLIALLDAGARIDETDWRGQTALLLAIDHRNYLLASYLLDRGADPGLKDNHGRSASDGLRREVQGYSQLQAKIRAKPH